MCFQTTGGNQGFYSVVGDIILISYLKPNLIVSSKFISNLQISCGKNDGLELAAELIHNIVPTKLNPI